MQTLESMRRRIESANDLHAVVRVMKALAAVSIRQYERAVESLAEYSRAIELGMQAILRQSPESRKRIPSGDQVGIVVFGSDQGMCGSFNENIAGFALDLAAKEKERGVDPSVVVVGMRAVGRLEDAGIPAADIFMVPNSVAGIPPVVHDLLLKIESLSVERGISRWLLAHQRMLSASSSSPRSQQILPLDAEWLAELQSRPWGSNSLPTHRMDGYALFSALVRQHLFVSIYRAFAESLASENANRLASMQAAEKNIEEHLAALSGRYNQRRQQTITEELLDIVSGFETLELDRLAGRL